MQFHCVIPLARLVRRMSLLGLMLGASASALLAQSTGKLEGRIQDQNGQAVASARVNLVGTAFSATTNPQGYWFINSVPAGSHDLRASFVGYKPQEIRGVRVLSGQTITQDITLEQTAVEIEAITVRAAEVPLVPRDQVTTKQLIDGSYTDKLPVDNLNNVFALQPGVAASAGGTQLSVRGGRTDENVTYVDGVPVSPGNRNQLVAGTPGSGRGVPQLAVATNAFEDASITTGASSAEFGNAQGGVIAITTRTGGQRFSGNVGFETDEFSGLRQSAGFNRLQASLGGPILGNLTFFVGGQVTGTRFGTGGLRGYETPDWVPVGVDTTFAIPKSTAVTADTIVLPVYQYALYQGDCDADYAAGSTNAEIASNYGYDCRGNRGGGGGVGSNIQLNSKLSYSFGSGSRISLSYLTSRALARNQTAADGTGGVTNTSQVITMNWNQVLSKSSSRALALDTYLSYQSDRSINSILTTESELGTRDPFLGWQFSNFDYEYGFDEFPVTDELIRNYRLQDANAKIVIYDRFNTTQYQAQAGYGGSPGNPGNVAGFGAAPGTLNTARESRLIGKANLDWQVDRYNRMKMGVEYTQTDMDNYSIGATGQQFSDIWAADPVRYNLFVEDRLDLGDVVLVGGLRYDFFDIGAEKWKDFPRISSAPGFDPDNLEDYLEPYESHDYISPHIQVAFPVTDRTNFRLSYAQQVQAPDASVVLFGSNTDLAITNTNNNYGSDLDFGKTILFEFGVRHAFSDDMVLDVTVYNKDNLANAAGRLVGAIDPRTESRVDLRQTVNADFGNTRGIDMRVDRRFGSIFNGVLSYSYQDARNTGDDPFTYINFGSRITSAITGSAAPPPQAAQPVGFSRPHSLAAQFAFNFPADFAEGSVVGAIMSRMGIFGVARYASGTPYTRCDPRFDDDLAVTSGNPCNTLGGDFNAARLPAFRNVDLRMTKGFQVGGLDLTVYADARNVFNVENILAVFSQTGTTTSARLAQTLWATDSVTFAQTAQANGIYDAGTGEIALPGSDAACGAWLTAGNNPSPPTCYFYRKGEQRFGNGDGVYTLAEQRRASDINNDDTFHINRFTGNGRVLRFGMEVNF